MSKFNVPSLGYYIKYNETTWFWKTIGIGQVLENFTLNPYNRTVPRGALVDEFWEAKTRYNQYFTNYFSIRFHGTQILYQVLSELQNLCFTWYKKLSSGEQMRDLY